MRHAPLFERSRPQTFAEVVGQDRAIACLDRLGHFGGRAFYLSGPSGTGKTTLARLIALEIADPLNVEEIDATGLSAAAIQDLERSSYCYGLGGKSGRAFIINEAHGLSTPAIRQLLTTLERIPGHVVWIFTTTDEGDAKLFDTGIDAHPLLSRCVELPMARQKLAEPIANRLMEIAAAEGIPVRSPKIALEAVRQRRNNFRAVLQDLEAGMLS